MKSDFGSKVVVEEEKGPGSSLTPFKWTESISGKTKSDIAWIGEIFM
jgi:hypothetical protein